MDHVLELAIGVLGLVMFLLSFIVAGVGASFRRRGWLLVPAITLYPLSFVVLGAFDDGESLLLIAAWTAFWPALVAAGFAVGIGVRHLPA